MKQFSDKLFRASKEEAFRAICSRQVDVVINLETETPELIFGGANDELIHCYAHGLALYDFALGGVLPPDANAVWWILHLIRNLEREPDIKILVHCRHGKDRTGFVVAAYRMQAQGWTFDKAFAEWKAEGAAWIYRIFWKRALKAWEPAAPIPTSTSTTLDLRAMDEAKMDAEKQ